MDFLSDQLANGGACVGIAWAIREIGAFILKWRKQNQELYYKPEQEWKHYVTSKFDEIQTSLRNVFLDIESLKSKVKNKGE